jgi:carbon storage regulator CsrA
MGNLILSRKAGQRIVIGEGDQQAVITIAKICTDRVKVGIEASPDVPIMREELTDDRTDDQRDKAA